jgi:hypothetical protein
MELVNATSYGLAAGLHSSESISHVFHELKLTRMFQRMLTNVSVSHLLWTPER